MRALPYIFVLFSLGLSLSTYGQEPTRCIIRTTLGDISVELFDDQSPVTTENFLYYVDHHLYDSSHFFRVCTQANEASRPIRIEVIQGGDVPEEDQREPIRLESTRETGLSHLHGTLSMARDTPDSATSSFFICIGDQPELDYGGKRNSDGQGFAAFGKVLTGMDVVQRIQQQEEKNQYLIDPVVILSVDRQ